MHYLCLKSCIEINKPSHVYLYYHYEPFGYYWELIKPYLTLEKVSTDAIASKLRYHDKAVSVYQYAHVADFIRLEKILEKGGIYADIDTLFVRSVPQHFFDQQFVLGKEPDIVDEKGKHKSSLCNAYIASQKGAEFGQLWLSKMLTHFDGSWSNHSTVLPAKLSKEHPSLIYVAPQSAFYDFIWTMEGIANLFENKINVSPDVYSIHLWAHLWWDRSRKDFSNFHHKLLNHAYVNRAETTYAALAKPFLPAKPPLKDIITSFFKF